MQITRIAHGDLLELGVAGRLDAEWAATLRKAIDDALRQGYHAVLLDISELQYVSSAGLAVLVSAHQQFRAIRGFFGVGGASGLVDSVIRKTGLANMLLCDLETARRARGQGRSTIQLPSHVVTTASADFEIYSLNPGAHVSWRVVGDPSRFDRGAFSTEDATSLEFTENTCAVGIGAFGNHFETGAAPSGELLAVAGAVAMLPGDGARLPDFQVARGEFVPTAHMMYGVSWTADFSQLLRFDVDDGDQRLTLTQLVNDALTLIEGDAAAFVVLAETAGLVGAALRRPPMTLPAANASRFDHPEIRDWLFFTPERAFPHSLALIAGVASRTGDARRELEPFLRPFGASAMLHGHFHAAVFPFQPFKKRRVELVDTVPNLFESSQLQGLLHLIHDERPITGAGDSEFLRGACWVGPLTDKPDA